MKRLTHRLDQEDRSLLCGGEPPWKPYTLDKRTERRITDERVRSPQWSELVYASVCQ
jgi:hypothetical protein